MWARFKNRAAKKGNQVDSLAQYELNLRALAIRMKKTGATLIFATTTPVPRGTLGRIEGDERHYNEVRIRVIIEEGVMVDDLHGLVVPQSAQAQKPKASASPCPRQGLL